MTAGQVLAVIVPDELRADLAIFAQTAQGLSSRRVEWAALRYQSSRPRAPPCRPKRPGLAAHGNSRLRRIAQRETTSTGCELVQSRWRLRRARSGSGFDAANARVPSEKVEAARRRCRSRNRTPSRSRCAAASGQSRRARPAADAQKTAADVRLAYQSPVAVRRHRHARRARQGEVVGAGQPIVPLINPTISGAHDVRDYIDRLKPATR